MPLFAMIASGAEEQKTMLQMYRAKVLLKIPALDVAACKFK